MAAGGTKGEAKFRRWLIEKVKQSSWAHVANEAIEDTAQRIGVQTSVLLEAQRELDADNAARGDHGGAAPGRTYVQTAKAVSFTLPVPKRVHVDWKAYCVYRDIKPSTMLRSLIHSLLSGPKDPDYLSNKWRYRGRLLTLEQPEKGRRHPYRIDTLITQGARRALVLRARSRGCTKNALVRGQVLELLEGRLEHFEIVTGPMSMHEDETKYWTGD